MDQVPYCNQHNRVIITIQSVGKDRPWSSLEEGGVTLTLRFSIQLKSRLFYIYGMIWC